ncbi:MAG: hypothetical protein HY669_00700 [Chloroflexi bacterium]|nr:hypothetical protein [Chloroflexota bacterium]
MEKWQQEISQILGDDEARDLARFLINWTKHISAPHEAEKTALDAILKDVAQELPVHRAMWLAFYLGAAWQRGPQPSATGPG